MRKWVILLAFFGMSVMLSACGSHAVATINGKSISQNAYYQNMKQTTSGQQALVQMLLDQGLKAQYGDHVTQAQIDHQYNAAKKQYGSSFKAALAQNGMTPSQYRTSIHDNLLLKTALRKNIKFTPTMLKQQFKNYQPKVTVNQILVAKKATAEKVIQQLNAGKSFAKLAATYSTDTATSKKSGRISPFDNTNTTLDPNFKKAAFQLKTGQYTKKPVKTQYGYEIIQMVNHPAKGTYQDHEKALKNQIVNAKMNDDQTVHQIIAKVLKHGKAQVHDKDLQNVLAGFERAAAKA